MKTAIILHGKPPKEEYLDPDSPSPSNAHWLPWLPLDAGTMLVGHSCGGGFLVRWLSEHALQVGRVALVAPWIDPDHNRAQAMFDGLHIDTGLVARTRGIRLFISSDDGEEILATAALLETVLKGIHLHRFSDRGHFTSADMETEEFPELRDFLIDEVA